MAQQKVKILIPKRFQKRLTPLDRDLVADEIIEFIQIRTVAGEDKRGKQFPKYTARYAKKKGVSRGDVDLVMDKEMLRELETLRHKRSEIVIGYDKDDEELNGKVEGNIKGTYGRPSPIPGKKRDFLGITAIQRNRIIMDVINGKI